MKSLINISVFLGLVLVCYSCKKDTGPSSDISTGTSVGNCKLTNYVSPDSNYIPHKLNNQWSYCSCSSQNCYGWSSEVRIDTFYNKEQHFSIRYTPAQPLPTGFTEQIIVDSNNVYTSINCYSTSPNIDTVLIINPKANNGDTIFKNEAKQIYTVLINKSDVFSDGNITIQNCYHIKIYSINFSRVFDNYYKKGVGFLNFNGFKMWNCVIN